jgi:hypothetical protein
MTDPKDVQSDEDRARNEDNSRLPVLCLVRDLLFYSKIRAAAESADVPLKSLREPARLADEVGRALIVDLSQQDALPAAAGWRQRTGLPVAGFVSHLDTDTITVARAAGIDHVLARSQFEKNLRQLLSDF